MSESTVRALRGLSAPYWRTVRRSDTPNTQRDSVSRQTYSLRGGPSAPLGRTVRSPTFKPKPEKQPLWTISLKHLRTVHAPGADCLQHGLQAQTELQPLWTKRIILADRPPNRTGPSAHHFFFPQVDQHQIQHFLLCKCASNTK